jgi:hypothetical protein
VPLKPSSGLQTEISLQGSDAAEDAGILDTVDMLMISLACLVVETHDTYVIHDEGEAVLEVVHTAPQRLRHTPYCGFDEHTIAEALPQLFNPYGIHHTPSPTVM